MPTEMTTTLSDNTVRLFEQMYREQTIRHEQLIDVVFGQMYGARVTELVKRGHRWDPADIKLQEVLDA